MANKEKRQNEKNEQVTQDNVTQKTPSPAASSTPSETLDKEQLEHELHGQFPSLQHATVILSKEEDQAHLVLASATTKEAEQSTLARQIVAYGSQKGLTFLPLVYSEEEWNILEARSPGGEWIQDVQLAPQHGALIDLYQKHRMYPKELRHLLVKTFDYHLAFFSFINRSLLFPSHLRLAFCATVMSEALELLFSTEGGVFSGSAKDLEYYERHFASKKGFTRNDIYIYFQVSGLARQAKHYYLTTADDSRDFDTATLIKDCTAFLEACKRYFQNTLTSDEERLRHRRIKMALAAGVGVFVVALFLVYLVLTWPLAPISDPDQKITATGGITGTYYNGRNFNKEVLKRTDTNINFDTMDSLAPNVSRDNFSIRWKGYLFFPEKKSYVLCGLFDDGAKIYFNNKILISDWNSGSSRKKCERIHVRRGWYPLAVEYFDLRFKAVLKLLRGENELTAEGIPAKHFCCKEPGKNDSKKVSPLPSLKPIPPVSPKMLSPIPSTKALPTVPTRPLPIRPKQNNSNLPTKGRATPVPSTKGRPASVSPAKGRATPVPSTKGRATPVPSTKGRSTPPPARKNRPVSPPPPIGGKQQP